MVDNNPSQTTHAYSILTVKETFKYKKALIIKKVSGTKKISHKKSEIIKKKEKSWLTNKEIFEETVFAKINSEKRYKIITTLVEDMATT